jgi:hypothetical protein
MSQAIDSFESLICPNCGAALPASSVAAGLVTCQYCGTTFRIPGSLTPQPDLGDLILGADFRRKPIAGWNFPNEDNVQLLDGAHPELRAKFPAKEWVYYALSSAGFFDDIDASVSMIFYSGSLPDIDAGISLRYRKGVGSYTFQISPLGTYAVGYYAPGSGEDMDWHHILSWTKHAAIRPGLDQFNRLRVVGKGDRLHVYINGVLATSIHDDRYDIGEVLLLAEAGKQQDIEVGFTDLQLREVVNG